MKLKEVRAGEMITVERWNELIRAINKLQEIVGTYNPSRRENFER